MKRLFAIFCLITLVSMPVFSQKKEVYKVRTVVIDPGHGGAKPGARGSRSYEKNITLAIAKKFGKLIEDNYPDVKVIYTRTTDVDISLAERANIANRNKADLFISIHANSHPTSTPTGVETFVMGLSESKANLEVAKKENSDILLESDYKNNADYQMFDPNSEESYVLLTMFQNAYIDKSLNFAQSIQTQYKRNIKTINRGVKQAELYVLYKTSMPSVLTEVGFISNPGEESFMLSDEGQAKLAICLFNAFMNYKSSEEGSSKIVNPIINIPGYKTSVEEKNKPVKSAVAETKQVEKQPVATNVPEVKAAQDTVAVVAQQEKGEVDAKPVEETTPEVLVVQTMEEVVAPQTEEESLTPEEPKLEPEVVEKALTPRERPLPGVELARREEPKQQEVVAAKAEPVVERRRLSSPRNTASESDKSYYTVQFLTSATPLDAGDPEFAGLTGYDQERKGKIVCYTLGRFATFKEASAYCTEVQQCTKFKDAWVTMHKSQATVVQNQAVEAKPSGNNQAETVATSSVENKPIPGVVFRIQFCTTPKDMKVGDPDLCGIKDFYKSPSGRYIIYSTGNYSTFASAQARCAEIHRTTSFKDAFVIALKDNKRVPIDELLGRQ